MILYDDDDDGGEQVLVNECDAPLSMLARCAVNKWWRGDCNSFVTTQRAFGWRNRLLKPQY